MLSSAETHPAAKRAAVAVARTLTNYETDETVADIAARLPAAARPFAAALHVPGAASSGRIVYPQFGGLTPDQASVMVVTEQRLDMPEGARLQSRTLDIRLRRIDGDWRFAELASISGPPIAPPPQLPAAARAVLADARIELPDSARWDIRAGRVAPTLLQLLARLADQTPFGVVTFSSGHPWEIFGTPRQSDHSRGRAVDIYRFADTNVIDGRTDGSSIHRIVQWLYDQPELARMGSPWALDGYGGRSFTDALHQDHIHLAVDPDDVPASGE